MPFAKCLIVPPPEPINSTNIFDTVIIPPSVPINTSNIFDTVYIIPPSVPINTTNIFDMVIIPPATPIYATIDNSGQVGQDGGGAGRRRIHRARFRQRLARQVWNAGLRRAVAAGASADAATAA